MTIRGRKLPQRDPNCRTGKPAVIVGDIRWLLVILNGCFDLSFQGDRLSISEGLQHRLKGGVALGMERTKCTRAILHGMGRMEMRARYPAFRNRFRRCMRALVLQELGKNMRVWSIWAFTIRSRDSLIDLDAAEPG
jgi:hypothetical protein